MNRMTMDDLLRMDAVMIPGTWAAQVMGMHPSRLIGYAEEKPHLVPFPHMLISIEGSDRKTMKVPRVPFLRWLGCTDEEIRNKRLR